MRFIVTRTSMWGDGKPCEEARQEIIDRIDTRCFPSPEAFDAKLSERMGAWESEGVDHKIIDDSHIQRTFPKSEKVWTVEIADLDQLMAFSKEHGELVIDKGDMPKMEIYDGYRE